MNSANFSVTIQIPGLPPATNGSHGHHMVKAAERKKWRTLAANVARANRPPLPLVGVEIECVRHSSIQMDYDNRVISFKPVIDGLKDAGYFVDDNDSVILKRAYLSEKAPPGRGYLVVTIRGTPMLKAEYAEHLRKQSELLAKRALKKQSARSRRFA